MKLRVNPIAYSVLPTIAYVALNRNDIILGILCLTLTLGLLINARALGCEDLASQLREDLMALDREVRALQLRPSGSNELAEDLIARHEQLLEVQRQMGIQIGDLKTKYEKATVAGLFGR